MQVLFLNNHGGGFADYVQVDEGCTIQAFLQNQLPGRTPSDYLIRVNRQPVPAGYVLQDGDRVSCTPLNIQGAH